MAGDPSDPEPSSGPSGPPSAREPADLKPPRAKGRAPPGVAAVLAGAAASLPVFLFDEIEVAAGRWFGEGSAAFVGVMAAFALAWVAVGLPLLALLAPRPAREGLWAGGLVALVMLWFLVGDGPPDEELPIRLFVWVPLGSLAVGFGAVTGLFAERLRRGRPTGGRGAAFTAVAAMALLAATAGVFLGPAAGPLAWGVLAVILAVAGGALAWLVAEGRRGRAE